MNEIVKKTLNRGAPIDTPVIINMNDFLGLFDNQKLYDEYRSSIKSVVGHISNIVDFHVGETFLPVYATITLGEDNTKELRFSGENLFTSIGEIFHPTDIKEIIAICESSTKFEEFKQSILAIDTPEELKRKFPRLYELYMNQIELNKGLQTLESVMQDSKESLEMKMKYMQATADYLKEFYPNVNITKEQEFMHDFNLHKYLTRIMNVITSALCNAEEIIETYQSGTLELNSFHPEDSDKLDLFIANVFMKMLESVAAEDKQRYLFYLTNYFRENVETKVTRTKIKVNEHKVTPISLYEKYKNVLVANPDLLAVNFSPSDFHDMSQEEVEDFITAYLADLSANWELLPSEDTSIEREIKNIAKRKYRKLSPEEQKRKQERLMDLYMEKKKFYDSTDPYFRIKGKETFDGYVGYIYPNSLVVLEKFYSNSEKKKIAENEAVYILSMSDFYELSHHSKSYLIANHLCHRVIHKEGWQERVLRYIRRKVSGKNPAEDTQKLIKDQKVTLKEKVL